MRYNTYICIYPRSMLAWVDSPFLINLDYMWVYMYIYKL